MPEDNFSSQALAQRLSSTDFCDLLGRYVDFVVGQGDMAKGYELWKALSQALAGATGLKQEQSLWMTYQKLRKRLGFLCLPFLLDKDAVELFRDGALTGLTDVDMDVQDKVEARLVGIILHEQRDAHKKQLVQALMENVESLGDKTNESQAVRTVGDWLRDYRNFAGASTIDAYKRGQYLSQNSAVMALDGAQRAVLRSLLGLFDYLQLSSLTPEGLEERVTFVNQGEKVILDKGQVRTLPKEPDDIIDKIRNAGGARSAAETPGEEQEQTIGVQVPPVSQTRQPVIPMTERELVEERTSLSLAPPAPSQPAEQTEGGIPSPQPVVPTKFVPPPETLPIVPLQPTPQAMKTARPAFFFDLEDEREADKHREKTEGSLTLEQELRRYADEVIQKNSLAFKDDVNKRRFIQLFVSRLKDVRGTVEVREALLKPAETGGLALESSKAEQVIGIMESAKREFGERLTRGEVKPQAEPVAPPAGAPLPPRPPLGASAPPQRPSAPAFDAGKAEEWRQQMLRELQTKAPAVAASTRETVRPQLMDVKAPPKVVGPLDELMTLSLVDFRRLGATPTEAFRKVRAKIDLIGETSIARRIEAVKAWHMSPVYRQYIALGRESIEQEKPVAQVITAHQSLGEKVLTEAEFNAVVDFNSKLRF